MGSHNSLWGNYLFTFEYDDNGKKITYHISGDARDVFAYLVNEDEDTLKENVKYPHQIEFWKMYEIFRYYPENNRELAEAILAEIKQEFRNQKASWISHPSIVVDGRIIYV